MRSTRTFSNLSQSLECFSHSRCRAGARTHTFSISVGWLDVSGMIAPTAGPASAGTAAAAPTVAIAVIIERRDNVDGRHSDSVSYCEYGRAKSFKLGMRELRSKAPA